MAVPRVDFYVLEEANADGRLRLACRLTEQAFTDAERVFVLASGEEEARRMDELLWTFRDRSFVPHDLVQNAGPQPPPVLIGTSTDDARGEVLINLTLQVPAGCERFARIIEPLDADAERRQCGRERYRAYREKGFTLQSNTLTASQAQEP